MELGPHAVYIWAAYASVGVGLATLVAWLVLHCPRQQHLFDQLEAQGVRRRSDRAQSSVG